MPEMAVMGRFTVGFTPPVKVASEAEVKLTLIAGPTMVPMCVVVFSVSVEPSASVLGIDGCRCRGGGGQARQRGGGGQKVFACHYSLRLQ